MIIYRKLRSLWHTAFGWYIFITHSEDPMTELRDWIEDMQLEIENKR